MGNHLSSVVLISPIENVLKKTFTEFASPKTTASILPIFYFIIIIIIIIIFHMKALTPKYVINDRLPPSLPTLCFMLIFSVENAWQNMFFVISLKIGRRYEMNDHQRLEPMNSMKILY